jgi:hypothetical protein
MPRGGRNKRRGKNGNGNGDGGDNGQQGKGKGNKKGKGNASRCGNFVDLSQIDLNKNASDLLQIYGDAKTWYETFIANISKKDVERLRESAAKAKVSWEVASVIAQLDQLYSRVEEYKTEAENQVRNLKLAGAFGQLNDASLLDANDKDVTDSDASELAGLYDRNELKLGVVRIEGKISKAKKSIEDTAISVAARTYERVSEAIALSYDRLNKAFYVGFDTQEMPGGLRIMVRFVIRNGEITDITGHDATTVPLDNTVFITGNQIFKGKAH